VCDEVTTKYNIRIIYTRLIYLLYIMMYRNDFMTKGISLYFMRIIDNILAYFENDDYNEKQKIKKYRLTFDDEFVML